MTDEQRATLERMIDRAGTLGLEVVAHGRRKVDGARIYCVPSTREPNRWHVVVRFGSHLVCDCQAAQYNRICVHRAATYVHLFNEAQRRQRLAEEVEEALQAERIERNEAMLHDATRRLERVQQELDHYDAEHPKLADDRVPVTCWK
jgi:hypothetical protein